jgi:hypothetical protein
MGAGRVGAAAPPDDGVELDGAAACGAMAAGALTPDPVGAGAEAMVVAGRLAQLVTARASATRCTASTTFVLIVALPLEPPIS